MPESTTTRAPWMGAVGILFKRGSTRGLAMTRPAGTHVVEVAQPRAVTLPFQLDLESASAVQILPPSVSEGLTLERWRLAGILDRHLDVVSNDGDRLVFELRTAR